MPAAAPVAIGDGRVLATVAHELRNPLHALTLSAELLDADLETLDRQEVRSMVRSMYRKAVWLEGLLENLLYAARPDEGVPLHRRRLTLAEVLADVTPLVQPFLAQRRQRLRYRGPGYAGHGESGESGESDARAHGHLPDVWADPRRIGQVLINLLVNASKFSPEGAPIDLRLVGRHGALRITVADRGLGLPPAGAAALFEPFRRGAAVEQAGIEGLGLGLAIAKSIVDAHGGRIGAAARRGGGALFWFELPALPAEPPASGDASARRRLALPARGRSRAAATLAPSPAPARERNSASERYRR